MGISAPPNVDAGEASVCIVMEMSHGVTMLVRSADNVAKVSCVLKGCSRLFATDPLGKEIGGVFDVRNVAHLDLPTLEALQEGKVAT